MAIRDLSIGADEAESLVMDVYLKNGASFLNKDIPKKPFGESGELVCFWNTQREISCYPLSEVLSFHIHLMEE